jgi:hypothetical protein
MLGRTLKRSRSIREKRERPIVFWSASSHRCISRSDFQSPPTKKKVHNSRTSQFQFLTSTSKVYSHYNKTPALLFLQKTPISFTLNPSTRTRVTLSLRFLLPRLLSLRRSLTIAPHHNHAQETPDHGAAEQQEDDRDANGPDAGREEGLDEVGVVDEGLRLKVS